jgi:DNA-binding NarL/FixJ family response regulator
MKNKIKIIIADDHRILLDSLKSLVADTEDIDVVEVANNGGYAYKLVEENPDIDVAVVDISMPNMDGIEVTRKIKETHPQVKILVLTGHTEVDKMQQVIEAGAAGYILKSKGGNELVTAIRAIHQGNDYFGKTVTDALIEKERKKRVADSIEKVEFTPREIDVLRLIGKGLSSKEIAEELGRAPTTIETHRRHLLEKSGVKNSKELILYAVKEGYTQD